ncbi:hypothetical protein EON65_27890 [archaeon]|nr:MAG: hypothetical protein EON65_27890 [archaeon]
MEGFINLPHITRTEPQSFEAEQRKSLSVLTPQLRTLLVSFIVNNGIRFGFTFKQAYAYYNEYLAKYSLGHESMDTVKSGISNLLDYAMVTRLNPTAKADQVSLFFIVCALFIRPRLLSVCL